VRGHVLEVVPVQRHHVRGGEDCLGDVDPEGALELRAEGADDGRDDADLVRGRETDGFEGCAGPLARLVGPVLTVVAVGWSGGVVSMVAVCWRWIGRKWNMRWMP
jgi:hypothetical protein